jgi:membrane peptidoglycan carboxypeptidase
MTRRAWSWLLFGLIFVGAAVIAAYELIASPVQAMFLADYAKRLNFHDEAGPSDSIRFPKFGPHDNRFGYSQLPEFTKSLDKAGFAIVRQARISSEMASLDKFGLFLPYREKDVTGLTLEDCSGSTYYSFRQPRHAYPDFASIPPVVANTLLFIENRELLDPNHPQRNPAVEWDRLGEAMLEKMVQTVQPGRHVPGGSTLATQLEKYRHADGGLTLTPGDKLRQMASASIRAYLDGPDTRVTRRRILLDYLNTVPLSAAPGFGEVDGVGDGLAAWFGLDFAEVNRLLNNPEPTPETTRAYKHVLGLLISQRKPSWYLISGRTHLDEQANTYLGLLTQAGIITPAFRDMARKQHIAFRDSSQPIGDNRFAQQKAVTAARTDLANMLDIDRLYDLDRLDLTVTTSLHAQTQQAVTEFLATLKDPVAARSAGLYAHRLLSQGDDLSKIIYSFTLYERTADGSALRVQADSLNQPFDINQGAKLGMGSSAKMRTMITYLEIITELHDQYAQLDAKALNKVKVADKDVLTQWAIDYLRVAPDHNLDPMLRAAMARRYSASTGEGFFTGGGLHHFANFDKIEDSQTYDVWGALQNSVNLSFIRLMRDIVRHFMYREPSPAADILNNADDPRRQSYLLRFAEQEGKTYLLQFYKKYRGLKPDQVTEQFYSRVKPFPRRLAASFRYLEPDADLAAFTDFIRSHLNAEQNSKDLDFGKLYATYAPGKFNLADQAYITQRHPLELWLVTYLHRHPNAHWDELTKVSLTARIDSYNWLYKSSRKHAQDFRILSLMEQDAFKEVFNHWQRVGYPFSSVVPSYATAIGSSADRPAALADLMGIILNDGIKQTAATYKRLDFADGTPYHTLFAPIDSKPVPLFPPEVAQIAREALINVVNGGTATRAKGAFVTQRGILPIGGKTGTGDNRFDTFAANGAILESRVVNRVATFVFFIGRHFYGVVTAYVPGEAAGHYGFTSALPVQVLKAMAPVLQPLVAAGESRSLGWKETLADFEAETSIPTTTPTATTAPPTTSTPALTSTVAAKVGVEPKVTAPEPMRLDYEFKSLRSKSPNAKETRPKSETKPRKRFGNLPPIQSPLQLPSIRPVPAITATPAPAPEPTPTPEELAPNRFGPANTTPGEGFRLID